MIKRILQVFLFISIIFLTGCKAHLAGKMDDYNEIITGTIDMDLAGHSSIKAELSPSGIRCIGSSTVTYIPFHNYLLSMALIPTCYGQEGTANMNCSDGRKVDANWRVVGPGCGKVNGNGHDEYNNAFTFYFDIKKSKAEKKLEEFKKEVASKPMMHVVNNIKPVNKIQPEPEKPSNINTGTGFFVSKEGHFITNYHVIDNSNKITVLTPDKKTLQANIIKIDPINDVALCKVNYVSSPLIINFNPQIVKGEEILVLGYPLTAIQGQEVKATFGRINAFSGIANDIRFYQIDASIQPGNSGSPLINKKGEVVGLVSASLSQLETLKATGILPQNVNYALKLDYLYPFIKDLTINTHVVNYNSFPNIIKQYENSVILVVSE